jgi:hypothetical protein
LKPFGKKSKRQQLWLKYRERRKDEVAERKRETCVAEERRDTPFFF